MRRSINSVVVLLVLIMLAGCGWQQFRAKAPFNATASHIENSPVSVITRNGSVEIIRDSTVTEVVIEAMVTCGGETQEEADQRIAGAGLNVSRDTARTLVITPQFPGGQRNGDGASFVVRMPDANGITINSSNGKVVVNGMSGPLAIDTSNGSVAIADHDGDAEVDTSNGSVTVNRMAGRLEADTSNGSIKVTDHLGSIMADTSNSSVTVHLHPDATGPVELDTSNGSIMLAVGPAFGGRVQMNTSNGSVKTTGDQSGVRVVSLKKSGGEVVIGDGGEASVLDTSNGNIELRVSDVATGG